MQQENGSAGTPTKALATTNSSSVSTIGEMSVQDIVNRKRKLVEVMNAVMIEGVHYGKIPGCGDKPSLFKPGAEIAALTFGLAPLFKISQVDFPGGHREYQIICTLIHIVSGKSLGEGVGSCSTMESKYRWRGGARLCPQCQRPAIIKSKFKEGGWYCFPKKDGCGAKYADGDRAIEGQSEERSENPDIADQYNTVLKMAKKRAQVDATLTATGASDILTQDLEDLPPGTVTAPTPGREASAPRDAEDADFVDRPAKPPAQKSGGAVDLDALRAGFTKQAAEAKTVDHLDEIAGPWRAFEKGTVKRKIAYEVYTARKESLEQAIAGSRQGPVAQGVSA